MTIYQAIPAIMGEIGAIEKDRKNESQGYKFRGIDDVYNAIHNLLIKYKVFMVPKVIEAKDDTVVNKNGNTLFYTRLLMEYTFWAEDGTSFVATVRGEGMDSGDKASNKAMAVAHKYAMIQVFAIPTENGDDPENESHDIKAVPVHQEKPKPVFDKRAWLKGRYLKLHRSKWLNAEDKVSMKEKMADANKDLSKIEQLVQSFEAIATAMAKESGDASYKEWISELEAAIEVGELEL